MTFVLSPNLIVNRNSLKDNDSKDLNSFNVPINLNTSSNHINLPNKNNEYPKDIFLIGPQMNNQENTYGGESLPSLISNNCGGTNNFNCFINSNTGSQIKESEEPLNNFLIKKKVSNKNNKLIKPRFSDESSNINNYNNVLLNNAVIINNQGRIRIKESAKFKKRKIFKKFKVFHLEPRKLKEKISYRQKHKRKYKPDDIRKKIKARFHKSIKNIVNENLKQAGSKYLFSFLPQIFISSISREKNHQVLNMSYRDLLKKDFVSNIDENKYKNKRVDLAKYQNNLNVLEYLDNHPDICEKSGFDVIGKMKYGDLLDEYFKSDEFEGDIKKLYLEDEEEDYIKEYINKAKSYVKFFSEVPFKININKQKKKKDCLSIEIKNDKKEENK
jgi:hypothetical protein